MAISPISIATDGFIAPEGGGGIGGNSRSFVGSSDGLSTTAAVLQVPTVIGLLGLSAGVSTITATLKKYIKLIGASDGVGTVNSVALERLRDLVGASPGAAVVTGDLAVDWSLLGGSTGLAQTISHLDGGTSRPVFTLLSVSPRHVDK
jgi:hypothetical protein